MKTKGWIAGCVVIAILIGGLVAFLALVPEVAEQLPPGASSLIVTLTKPLNGTRYPANSSIPVIAEAAGAKPITALELWVDGSLAERKDVPPSSSLKQSTSWKWRPAGKGEHFLIVRATDTDGRVGTSNVVHVTATDEVGFNLLYTPKPGDTVATVAQQFKTTPQQIADQNPQINPNNPLPSDKNIFIPIPPPSSPPAQKVPPPPPPPSGPVQLPSAPPDGLVVWWNRNVLNPKTAPLAPSLAASVDGCNVSLFLTDKSDNEGGFFVYRVDAQAPTPKRIATLGASDGTLPILYTDTGLSGHLEYYVSSFNGAGESPSNLYGVNIANPACTAPQKTGLQIVNGKLILPQAVDIAYFYFSANSGPWARVPSAPNAYLQPAAGPIDVVEYVKPLLSPPPLGKLVLDLEVWGWDKGKLVYLGTLKETLDRTTLTVCNLESPCTGDMGSTHRVYEAFIPGDAANQSRIFYWSADAAGATGGVWQISLAPFPQGPDLSPPGLVATGVAQCGASGCGETFKVDFRSLHPSAGKTPPAVSSPGGFSFPNSLQALQPSIFQSVWLPRTYYARVIPMIGNQPAGAPSNVVVINTGPSVKTEPFEFASPPPSIYDVRIVKFNPIVFEQSHLWGCVKITAVGGWADRFSVGQVVCPARWKGMGEKPWYEQFGDFLAAGIDWVAEAWSKLKELVVNLAATLNPICMQAKFVADAVDSGVINKENVSTVCHAGAAITVNMAMVAYGIPPTLPNSDQLMDMGKDALVELAADEFENQTGIPCEGECKDLMRKGLDATIKAIKGSKGNIACTDEAEAHKHGSQPLCLPDGVVGEPIPGATYQPASLVVEASRKPGSPDVSEQDYKKYHLDIAIIGIQDCKSGDWPVIVHYYGSSAYAWDEFPLKVECPLTDDLFKRVSAKIPRLAPGQTVTIPIVLEPQHYWIPGHKELVQEHGGLTLYDDWDRLYFGGAAKITVSVNCVSPVTGWKVNCGGFAETIRAMPSEWYEIP